MIGNPSWPPSKKCVLNFSRTERPTDFILVPIFSSACIILNIAVWQASTSNDDGTDKNNSAEPSTSTDNSHKDMEGILMFQELLKDLPGKVSGQTAKNLSVPIAFVCLLHLANEKVR